MTTSKLMILAVALVMNAGALVFAFYFIETEKQALVESSVRKSTEASNADVVAHVSHMLHEQLIMLIDEHEGNGVSAHSHGQEGSHNHSAGTFASHHYTTAYQDLDREVRHLLMHTRVAKFKVFLRDGHTVYSTDPEDLGKEVNEAPEIAQALRGRPTSHIDREGLGTGRARVVVESYHALRDDSRRVRGVVEVYAKRTEEFETFYNDLASSRARLLLIMLAIGLANLVPLIFVLILSQDRIRDEAVV